MLRAIGAVHYYRKKLLDDPPVADIYIQVLGEIYQESEYLVVLVLDRANQTRSATHPHDSATDRRTPTYSE